MNCENQKNISVFCFKRLILKGLLCLPFIFLCQELVSQSFEGYSKNKEVDSLFLAFRDKMNFYYKYDMFKSQTAWINKNLDNPRFVENTNKKQELLFYLISLSIYSMEYHKTTVLLDSVGSIVQTNDYDQLGEYYYYKATLANNCENYDEEKVFIQKADSYFKKTGNKYWQAKVAEKDAYLTKILFGKIVALPRFTRAYNELIGFEESYVSALDCLLNIMGGFYLDGEYVKALDIASKGFDFVCVDSNKNEISDLPQLKKEFSYNDFSRLLLSRSYVYRLMAKGNPDSVIYLTHAMNDAELSVEALERHKNYQYFDSDLLRYNNNVIQQYYKGMESVSQLYAVTQADSLLEKALYFSELDKASALLRGMQKDYALNHSGIPSFLINNVYYLQSRLDSIEAVRYKNDSKYNYTDEEALASGDLFYHLIQDIDSMESSLEKNYPEYKIKKYESVRPDTSFIMNLSQQHQIIEYLVSDEKVYSLFIQDGQLHFYDTMFPKGFVDSVLNYYQMIAYGDRLTFSLEEQNRFIQLSHFLYSILIQPFDSLLNHKPLLIVPDNELTLIPFETLLRKPVKNDRIDYKNLPYLVKDYDISYTYSLTLLDFQRRFSRNRNYHQVFAMAPGYGDIKVKNGNSDEGSAEFRDSLGTLLGAREEVEYIGRGIKSRRYFDRSATEEEFKKSAGKYNILHLAMHTLINDKYPSYSKLIFTPGADTVEDGLLNTYELRNMELNADLVVLSACNTGYGNVNRGEGIIGLSRGFLQAGAKTLVVTLWSVSDIASSKLIEDYYVNLKHGMGKAAGLSQTKRDYLAQSEGFYSHPYFWSGFILIGDPNEINLPKSSGIWWMLVVGGILIAALVLLLAKYKRKKPEGSGFQSN